MVETGPTSGSKNQYKYRADGMRVRKTGGGVTESVFYDGQMPVDTFEDLSGTANDVLTQNFVGARGIKMMETKVGSGSPTRAYPLYDGHGNMVATLTTSGTSWTVGNERSYDVWGSVRSGATTGGPKGRYVANLGHVQDDESGLIYMRARYYEPGTGRFVNEDKARDGSNWYRYCSNDPINRIDYSGCSDEFYQELGSQLADIGRAMITVGMVMFGLGVKNFYSGLATWGAMWVPPACLSPSILFLMLVGATLQIAVGIGAMVGGATRLRSGIYCSAAGAYLMALGEDGLEYAASFLQACDESDGGLFDTPFFEHQTGL